jgi:hypothetical protein
MSRKLKQVISCQSFSPISDVRDGIIVTKDGKFVKLMEFSPINYGLRSNEDIPVEHGNDGDLRVDVPNQMTGNYTQMAWFSQVLVVDVPHQMTRSCTP